MKKRMTAALLALALCLSLSACGGEKGAVSDRETAELSARSRDLMEGVPVNGMKGEPVHIPDMRLVSVPDFCAELFRRSAAPGENSLISPLSVLTALAMTTNGAEGNTLAQMEEVLGMTSDSLNLYLRWLLRNREDGDALSMANAVWFKEDEKLTVERAFLQANADYYGAGVYQAPFDDTTLRDINRWVEKNTDGKIPELLSELPDESVLCLVNALSFDGDWETIYKETQVRDGVFTTETGAEREVTYLHSTEKYYLEDELSTGFLKDYEGGRYSFVALLPKEGVSVGDCLAALTGEKLANLISSARQTEVRTSLPKFEAEYRVELPGILADMGMTDAFDEDDADFSSMGTCDGWPLYISNVIHKCTIAVDEKGTEAGAATAVLMAPAEGAPSPEEPKKVYLDRPFVYFIMDRASGLPVFAGTMMDPTL